VPNGHGGSPRFFSALILMICLIALYSALLKGATPWLGWIGYPLAAAFGWRLAYGLHMWKVTEYDGAYSSEEAIDGAIYRYLIGSVVYAVMAMVAWYFLT